MIIYKITNQISGKVYIGQTIRTIEKRWSEHCSSKSAAVAISQAIKKYGKENFKIEPLCSASNLEDLNYLEELFISSFKSLSPNGYNLTTGGDSRLMSEYSKKKMSVSKKGKVSHKKGKHYGYNTKLAAYMLGSKRGSYQMKDIPRKIRDRVSGFKWDKDIIKPSQNKEYHRNRKIIVTDKFTGIQIGFYSVTSAAKELGILRQSLDNVLSNVTKSTRQYFVEYALKNERVG